MCFFMGFRGRPKARAVVAVKGRYSRPASLAVTVGAPWAERHLSPLCVGRAALAVFSSGHQGKKKGGIAPLSFLGFKLPLNLGSC
jgi:hypothetical protein